MTITKLESGTYTRFQGEHDVVLEVFKVTETTAAETEPLETGKYYYVIIPGSSDPEGPFDTEAEALEAI